MQEALIPLKEIRCAAEVLENYFLTSNRRISCIKSIDQSLFIGEYLLMREPNLIEYGEKIRAPRVAPLLGPHEPGV